jgi:CubicO group peptidase (beta-lactamase class C family)
MDQERFDAFARVLSIARSRRQVLRTLAGLAAGGAVAALAPTVSAAPGGNSAYAAGGGTLQPRSAENPEAQANEIIAIAAKALTDYALNAVILRVTIADREVVTAALGESMTGVPATTDMHFHNGSVAISYLSTLLLRLVDQGKAQLDDPLATWLPDLPDADTVTLRMLANMTAGYPDFQANAEFVKQFYENPFRQWPPEERIALGLSTPRVFAPGTNWDYSHTNYVILGQALEKIGGQPMHELMQEQILDPLGLTGTQGSETAAIPPPVLHAFTSERREALGIPAGTRFYEESTFWNPSWTLAQGAIQTTTIVDMTATAIAVGEGTLLSPESHAAQVEPRLVGFGAPLEGCPTCHTLDTQYNYGLGLILSGDWQLQSPLFAGSGAVEGYLPSHKIAIAVATTYAEASFDDQGNYKYGNVHQTIFNAIARYLAPDAAPPGSAPSAPS